MAPVPSSWPSLPPGVAYLVLDNAKRRNALSKDALLDLKRQLLEYNTSKVTGQVLLLPPFDPNILGELEAAIASPDQRMHQGHGWLIDSSQWQKERESLPSVLVLRSEGPVFSSGHDLGEIRDMSNEQIKELFDLCAEVMSLIRRSPIPTVGAIHGFATAAGCQLALNTDLPIARASTEFRLPGSATGFPCSSPVTAVFQKFGGAFGYRMLSLAESYRADQLPAGVVDVVKEDVDLEVRVVEVVEKLAKMSPRPQALAKWAFWTQAGMSGSLAGANGVTDPAAWSGKIMALHLQTQEGRDSVESFFKRKPQRARL